jgi:prolyl oligopeptidase PreP (S9A serine peptidase family)
MLRYTQLSAGVRRIAEHGDPANPAMRSIIARWSPYQNLKPGVKYPRVFFLASTAAAIQAHCGRNAPTNSHSSTRISEGT